MHSEHFDGRGKQNRPRARFYFDRSSATLLETAGRAAATDSDGDRSAAAACAAESREVAEETQTEEKETRTKTQRLVEKSPTFEDARNCTEEKVCSRSDRCSATRCFIYLRWWCDQIKRGKSRTKEKITVCKIFFFEFIKKMSILLLLITASSRCERRWEVSQLLCNEADAKTTTTKLSTRWNEAKRRCARDKCTTARQINASLPKEREEKRNQACRCLPVSGWHCMFHHLQSAGVVKMWKVFRQHEIKRMQQEAIYNWKVAHACAIHKCKDRSSSDY